MSLDAYSTGSLRGCWFRHVSEVLIKKQAESGMFALKHTTEVALELREAF